MAVQAAAEDSVLVQSSLFDRMRQHCNNCPTFNIPQQHVHSKPVTTELSRKPKKRKALQSLDSSRHAPTNDTTQTNQAGCDIINLQQQHPQSVSESALSRLSTPGPPHSGLTETSAQSDPSSSPPPKKVKAVQKSRRDLAVDRFVHNTRSGNQWRERQLELGLDTVEKYERITQRFLRRSHALSKEDLTRDLRRSENGLIAIGKELAVLTKSSLEIFGLQRSFAYFQVFIVLSYCAYLRKKSVPYPIVDEIVRTIADIRERDRKALLDTVPWIHRLIVELVRQGWTLPRATELFFMNAISISDLVCIRSEETFEAILKHFTTDSFVGCSYDDCLTPSYSVPQLIGSLSDWRDPEHQISLIELYETLGYNLPNLPHSISGIYKVQNARSSPASQKAPEFEVLTQESFVQATTNDFNNAPEGEEQTVDSYSPPWNRTGSCPFQSHGFASTSSITPNQSNHSTLPMTPSQNINPTLPMAEGRPSLTLNNINNEVAEQAARNAQDPSQYSSRHERNQLGQGSSSGVRLRCRNDDVQGFFFGCSRSLYSPPPPQALLTYDNLFRATKIYFENHCRNMIFDEHGTLLNQNGTRLSNDLCNDFDSYCFTATMLIKRNLKVEFRHALSKASALVKRILQAQHPRTLACFLEVFIHLIQTGLPDVANFFRCFIKAMSVEVIRDGQPWGQICRLLGELDFGTLDEGLAQIWKCTTDTFESALGTSSRLAVSVRLDYLKRVYGVTNKLQEERLLRDLLHRFDGNPSVSTPRVMLNLAHNLNRQRRHEEAENMARKVLLLLQEHEIYAERIAERIECLKIVSHSQFSRNIVVAAEHTMREAIQMIVDQWGRQHSWFFEFMNVLQSWLKDWGRDDDANKLREEIEMLRTKDVIDRQLDEI